MPDKYVNRTGSRPLKVADDEPSRWEHRFSQSMFNTFQTCPEQARAIYFREVKSEGTSHTVRGVAMHAGIEYALHEKLDGRIPILDDMIQVAHHELDEIGEWKQTGISVKKVYADQASLLGSWLEHVEPLVHPMFLEWTFDYLLYSGKHRDVRVVGSIDCVDESYEVWDWKSAGRPYEPWQKQRSAVQPTVYCYAVEQITAFEGLTKDSPFALTPSTFHYAIMLGDEVQLIDVHRDETHVSWLRQQASQIAWMIENMPDGPWPLNDAHALCGPKWCPLWDECKGKHMIDGWDKNP